MAKIPNHLHKYKRVNLATEPGKKYLVYKCQVPTCSHYVPLHLAEGKLCECNRCGEVMVISKLTLNHSGGRSMALPHCPDCIKRKDADNVHALAAVLEKIEPK